MEPKKKKSNPLPKILIGIVTIGLLLGIGIYVFLNYFSKPGDRILLAATNTLSGNQFATAAGGSNAVYAYMNPAKKRAVALM